MIKKATVNTLIKSKLFFLTLSFLAIISCSDKILKKHPSPHRTNIIRSTATKRSSSRRQVIPEKITINSEFYGPFSKNRMEIIFFNPARKDTLEARFFFNVSKNSFVKELYLEIDGKLKKSENYRRSTAGRIYERITGLRRDPALLTFIKNGRYILNVYPVPPNKRRKIIIEYFSILETDENSNLIWNFSTPSSTNIKMFAITDLLPGSRIETQNKKYFYSEKTNKPLNLEISDSNRLEIKFSFEKTKTIFRFFNDNTQFLLLNESHLLPDEKCQLQVQHILNYRRYPYYNDEMKILAKLVKNTKSNNEVNIPTYSQLSEFGEMFIRFLIEEKSLSLNKINLDKKLIDFQSFWIKKCNNWYYYDDNISILPESEKDHFREHKIHDVYCPFLNEFIKYNQIFFTDVDSIITTEYLIPHMSKLVLDDSKQAMRIKQEELQREKAIRRYSKPLPTSKAGVQFIPYDEAPTPIGGFKTIQNNVIYPEEAIKNKIEGTVILRCFVSKYGFVTEVIVLKSSNEILNEAAINAIKITIFKPARQRDRFVGVYISIPVVFKLSMIDKNKLAESKYHHFKIADKYFEFKKYRGDNIFTEVGFDSSNVKVIEYMSHNHFEFLYNYPEFLKYNYPNLNICFSVDKKKSQWVLIKR